MVLAQVTNVLSWMEPLLCVIALAVMFKRRIARTFRFAAWYLAVRVTSDAIAGLLISPFCQNLEPHLRYHLYYWAYSLSFALEVVLGFCIIYSIFILAMEPLPGLQRLGHVMFRWAGGISLALSVAMAFGPRVSSPDFVSRLLGQLQQTESVLTLCMLFFVCVTVSPMGLSSRSRIFGICLGFGVNAAAQLIGSAWLGRGTQLYSLANLFNGLAICVSLGIWTLYFALPEPRRRIIMLPTTSPFLRWNQISAVLGDAPGFVALGTVTQDMFAPAEVEMMRRASEKMSHAFGD